MRKFSLFGLAILIVVSMLLAGCTSESTQKPNTSAPKETEKENENQGKESAEPMEIEIAQSGTGFPDPDPIAEALNEALGIKLKINALASSEDYFNQLNVRLAAGNYPDIILTQDRQRMAEYARKGMLLDLTPYRDKLQPVVDFVGEDNFKKGFLDGQQVGIPRIPDVPFSTWWVRKDWLDNLGLEAPTNLDEIVEVAKAFTFDDPDQNGKNDTYAMTGGGLSAFLGIFSAYGVGQPGNFYVKDGEVINSLYDPAMKDALAKIKELIDLGVVDPELIANTARQHIDKMYKGQFGLVYHPWTDIAKTEAQEQIKMVNPDAEWLQIKAPTGPGGNLDGVYDVATVSRLWSLPKSMENDPEKLDKILELFNYVSEREGNLLVMYGIEGKNFDLKGDTVEITDPKGVEHSHYYQMTGRPNAEYLAVKFGYAQKEIDFAIEQPRVEIYDSLVTLPDGYVSTDAERYISEEMIKFVYGNRSLDEYDDFLKTLETTFNYKVYLDAATEQITEFINQ
ncbi:extracellular solute-binding protein [Bacillus niameyensis]|uniref:extracellular solute-binding protein n=1 Tax=Bacillus niameyensis TaxID=1522308 RepID=UPI0007830287|nr:extracellular solute-binding protein [Bacillus niameyensis]